MESSSCSSSPILLLPHDTLYQIFSTLPLRQIAISRSVCNLFNQILTSPTFLPLPSTLPLIALRPPHPHHHRHPHPPSSSSSSPSTLHSFDPSTNLWLSFPLTFLLPFTSLQPITSSNGLLYLWADHHTPHSSKSLIACNPITRRHVLLPRLGSAWSRHGSLLVDPSSPRRVVLLTELATLCFPGSGHWFSFPSNLPSKPRSPLLLADSMFALCDVGSPWRNQWKLFSCRSPWGCWEGWRCFERAEWGEVFDVLKRPRLVKGKGARILMVGGLRSSFSLNSMCSTIVLLELELGSMEWGEAGRMPSEMFECFRESSKFKVFGGGERVCFSSKRMGRLALWDRSLGRGEKGQWRWIDGAPTNLEGPHRGFIFDADLQAMP